MALPPQRHKEFVRLIGLEIHKKGGVTASDEDCNTKGVCEEKGAVCEAQS